MKRYILLVSIAFLVGMSYGQEVINNGGFEDDVVYWDMDFASPAGEWKLWWDGISLTSDYKLSGERSLLVSTERAVEKGFASQKLVKELSNFELSFKMQPLTNSFYTSLLLVSNWDFNVAQVVLTVLINNDTISMSGPEGKVKVPYIFPVEQCQKISVVSDKSGSERTLIINNIPVISVNGNTPTAFNTIILGDITYQGMSGTIVFDDISVTNSRGNSFWAHNVKALKKNAVSQSNGLRAIISDGHGENNNIMQYDLLGRRIIDREEHGIYFQIEKAKDD